MRLHSTEERLNLGKWTRRELDEILRRGAANASTGRRIAFLSSQFLTIPYGECTLIGGSTKPEVFTIDLEAVDCFTYIDYVEAMRRSFSFASFKQNLRRVRYRGGRIAFATRKHFFTDWAARGPRISDVTAAVGGKHARKMRKMLNVGSGGTHIVAGLPPVPRDVTFIPRRFVANAAGRLKTGDYIGIYSEAEGLDVSHVGILIRKNARLFMRHASSVERKVVDQDFSRYTASKPGIIVLRPA